MDQIKTNKTQQNIDVEEFSPLVWRIAGSISNSIPKASMSTAEDLYQVGIMMVLEALPRYDASKGASLNTYLNIRVKGAMLDELRRMDPLTKGRRKRIREGKEDAPVWVSLAQQDIREENEWSQKDVLDEYSFRMYPDPVFDEVLLMELKEQAYKGLYDDRQLAYLYINSDMVFREIGSMMSISESRVCQIFKEATKHIHPLVD